MTTKKKKEDASTRSEILTQEEFSRSVSKDFRILTGMMFAITQNDNLLELISLQLYPKYVEDVQRLEAEEKAKRTQLDFTKPPQ